MERTVTIGSRYIQNAVTAVTLETRVFFSTAAVTVTL